MVADFSGKSVLITGGLGFIGSNLAHRLVQLGARVTLLDNFEPRHGANLFNITGIEQDVRVVRGDIVDPKIDEACVQGKEYVFHLAGQCNHLASMRDPFHDAQINFMGTLALLEACRKINPGAVFLFTGTRGQYGSVRQLPVPETHLLRPKGIYAVTNTAAELAVLMYHDSFGLKTVCARMTNTYGPRHQMQHDEYGVVNWFIRKAMDGDTIKLMGDGTIKRDVIFVDDAIDALLSLVGTPQTFGHAYNVATSQPISFRQLAETIVAAASSGGISYTPFDAERKTLEPGDFSADITKITQDTGWKPQTALNEGLRKTITFYRQFKQHYW